MNVKCRVVHPAFFVSCLIKGLWKPKSDITEQSVVL